MKRPRSFDEDEQKDQQDDRSDVKVARFDDVAAIMRRTMKSVGTSIFREDNTTYIDPALKALGPELVNRQIAEPLFKSDLFDETDMFACALVCRAWRNAIHEADEFWRFRLKHHFTYSMWRDLRQEQRGDTSDNKIDLVLDSIGKRIDNMSVEAIKYVLIRRHVLDEERLARCVTPHYNFMVEHQKRLQTSARSSNEEYELPEGGFQQFLVRSQLFFSCHTLNRLEIIKNQLLSRLYIVALEPYQQEQDEATETLRCALAYALDFGRSAYYTAITNDDNSDMNLLFMPNTRTDSELPFVTLQICFREQKVFGGSSSESDSGEDSDYDDYDEDDYIKFYQITASLVGQSSNSSTLTLLDRDGFSMESFKTFITSYLQLTAAGTVGKQLKQQLNEEGTVQELFIWFLSLIGVRNFDEDEGEDEEDDSVPMNIIRKQLENDADE